MNRFIPKSAERQAPFFATLKAATKFSWTEECSKAFEELKSFLTTPPTLASPLPGDTCTSPSRLQPSAQFS
ncbi:hypothetical protein LINPERPRIM_LOCUS7006 [Linum perenne]